MQEQQKRDANVIVSMHTYNYVMNHTFDGWMGLLVIGDAVYAPQLNPLYVYIDCFGVLLSIKDAKSLQSFIVSCY